MSRPPLTIPLALALLACGRPKPEAEAQAQRLDEPEAAPRGDARSPRQRPAWQRKATPMPETFAGFPRPELSKLDGVWVVDTELGDRAVVWDVEDAGTKLTIVDRHGQARIHGITLSSPCALRLTDEAGRAQARAVAQLGERLIISSKGSIAVAAEDGSLLACVGHRTYQIAADGRCRYTTEMLGAWSEPVDAKDACELGEVDGARVLSIAGQTLREQDGSGVWLDEAAAAAVARPVDSREAGLAALVGEPEAAGETGTGGTETGAAPPAPGETG